jgi:hypothetical protein
MVKRVDVSARSVHNIIHGNVKHHKKSITKVYHLTAAAVPQRKKKALSPSATSSKASLLDYQNEQTDFFISQMIQKSEGGLASRK